MGLSLTSISIIGSGWVGENVGCGFQKLENEVSFYDKSEERVQELKEKGLEATLNLEKAFEGSEVSFLCLPTPAEKGKINLKHLKSAAKNLGSLLENAENYHLVVIKSTVVPGTAEEEVIPLLENHSGKKVGRDIGVCVNPEFMTEISESWSDEEKYKRGFFSEDRIVIGEYDEKSGDELQKLYEPLATPIVRTDLKTAEMIKYASNCALASKISYWNEIFQICNRSNIDSDLVAETVAMDPRIGEYGTVHGKAFGGKCLPKDLRAFIDFAEEELDYRPELLEAIENVNQTMAEKYGIRE